MRATAPTVATIARRATARTPRRIPEHSDAHSARRARAAVTWGSRAGWCAAALNEDRRRGSRGFSAAGRVQIRLAASCGPDHRRAPRVDGIDDLGVIDALQIHERDAEVGVPELALDDDQRHALARHLNGMGMAQLVRREAPPHTGLVRHVRQVRARRGGRPGPSAGRSVDHAEQRSDGQLDARLEPRRELFPGRQRGVGATYRRRERPSAWKAALSTSLLPCHRCRSEVGLDRAPPGASSSSFPVAERWLMCALAITRYGERTPSAGARSRLGSTYARRNVESGVAALMSLVRRRRLSATAETPESSETRARPEEASAGAARPSGAGAQTPRGEGSSRAAWTLGTRLADRA